jgi:hypothetical protein
MLDPQMCYAAQLDLFLCSSHYLSMIYIILHLPLLPFYAKFALFVFVYSTLFAGSFGFFLGFAGPSAFLHVFGVLLVSHFFSCVS